MGLKLRLKNHFFDKKFEMDIGQLFWLYVDIVLKQCVKVHLVKFVSFACVLNEFPNCEC